MSGTKRFRIFSEYRELLCSFNCDIRRYDSNIRTQMMEIESLTMRQGIRRHGVLRWPRNRPDLNPIDIFYGVIS